jgi:hypothetical protein
MVIITMIIRSKIYLIINWLLFEGDISMNEFPIFLQTGHLIWKLSALLAVYRMH